MKFHHALILICYLLTMTACENLAPYEVGTCVAPTNEGYKIPEFQNFIYEGKTYKPTGYIQIREVGKKSYTFCHILKAGYSNDRICFGDSIVNRQSLWEKTERPIDCPLYERFGVDPDSYKVKE